MPYVIRPARPFWWLNPACIVCTFHIPVALASAIVPAVSYEVLWGVPKYFSPHILLLTLATCVCVCIGYAMGTTQIKTGTSNPEAWPVPTVRVLETLFRITLILTIIGYVLFLVSAYSRGFSAGMFVELLRGQRGAATALKREYFKPFTGLTSCTQFGMASAAIGVLLARLKGWKKAQKGLLLIAALAFCRAIFVSERLALMELLVPAAVLAVRLFTPEINRNRLRRTFMRIVPLAAPVCLYIFFAISEYFRSWSNFYSDRAVSFWEFAFGRLSGYYLTSMNNAAFLLGAWNYPSHLPFFTCGWMWHFPVVSSVISDISYGADARSDYFDALLTSGLSPEFNNPGGMLAPQTDFGIIGGLLFWIISGFLLGKLYRGFSQGRVSGLLFYPFGVLSLMELPRMLYWTTGRAFPSIAFLIFAVFLIQDISRRAAQRRGRRLWRNISGVASPRFASPGNHQSSVPA